MAWSPYARNLWVQTTYTQGQYENPFLPSPYKIKVGQTLVQYGITDRWTVDATIGFGKIYKVSNYYPLAGVEKENPSTTKYGFIDHRFGLRYKILDEWDNRFFPTLSFRVGRIQKGDYDPRPQSLGDGANGWEANIYFAKDFEFYGLGSLGEINYRRRDRPIPPDRTIVINLYKNFLANWFILWGVRDMQSLGGNSFADPEQNEPLTPSPTDFQAPSPESLAEREFRKNFPDSARREKFRREEISLGYRDTYGNFYLLSYGITRETTNSPLLEILSFSANFSFFL